MTEDRSTSWSALQIYARVFATLRARPALLFGALGVVPSLWSWSFQLLRSVSSPQAPSDAAGVAHWVRFFVFGIGEVLWVALPLGGMTLIALGALRGTPIFFGQLVAGLRFFKPVALSQLFFMSPGLLVTALGGSEGVSLAKWLPLGLVFLAWAVVVLRGACVLPLIVDHGSSMSAAFRESWALTQGASWKILSVAVLFVVMLVPIALLSLVAAPLAVLVGVSSYPVSSLAFACVYERLRQGRASTLELSPVGA